MKPIAADGAVIVSEAAVTVDLAATLEARAMSAARTFGILLASPAVGVACIQVSTSAPRASVDVDPVAPLAAYVTTFPQGDFCFGEPATIIGDETDDVIVGTDGDDVILGLGGDDVILAGRGNDVVCAGDGDDVLRGGPGDDTLYGESGDDTIGGGSGGDLLNGGRHRDLLLGGPGPDANAGGSGFDIIRYHRSPEGVTVYLRPAQQGRNRGGFAIGDQYAGIERVDGTRFADTLTGDRQANFLVGRGGNDRGDGGDGTDRCRMIENTTRCVDPTDPGNTE